MSLLDSIKNSPIINVDSIRKSHKNPEMHRALMMLDRTRLYGEEKSFLSGYITEQAKLVDDMKCCGNCCRWYHYEGECQSGMQLTRTSRSYVCSDWKVLPRGTA